MTGGITPARLAADGAFRDRGNPVLAQRAVSSPPHSHGVEGVCRMAVSDAKVGLINELKHRLDELRGFL